MQILNWIIQWIFDRCSFRSNSLIKLALEPEFSFFKVGKFRPLVTCSLRAKRRFPLHCLSKSQMRDSHCITSQGDRETKGLCFYVDKNWNSARSCAYMFVQICSLKHKRWVSSYSRVSNNLKSSVLCWHPIKDEKLSNCPVSQIL